MIASSSALKHLELVRRMINIITTSRYGYTHVVLTEEDTPFSANLITYEDLFSDKVIPRGVFVFTDFDRLDDEGLAAAANVYRRLKADPLNYRVLNDPEKVLKRYELLRTLYKKRLNPFNVYLTNELVKIRSFPVFVRHQSGHDWPVTSLIADRYELKQSLKKLSEEGVDDSSLMIVEFCAKPVQENVYQKLSAYRVSDKVFQGESVHEDNWCVKYGKMGISGDDLYQKELDMFLNKSYLDDISAIFNTANIEYGRMDYGLVDGEVVVFEINTNPMMSKPHEHPSKIRVNTHELIWETYLSQLKALDESIAPR